VLCTFRGLNGFSNSAVVPTVEVTLQKAEYRLVKINFETPESAEVPDAVQSTYASTTGSFQVCPFHGVIDPDVVRSTDKEKERIWR